MINALVAFAIFAIAVITLPDAAEGICTIIAILACIGYTLVDIKHLLKEKTK